VKNIFSLLILVACLHLDVFASLLAPGTYPMSGHYIGTLPCDDCGGVWTDVNLVDPGPNNGQGSGTFIMKQRFTGGFHGGTTLVTHGSWATVEPNVMNGYSGIIELRDESGETPRYFDCDQGRSLRLLDSSKHGISSPKNTSLKRVIPVPRPTFGPYVESDSSTLIQGRVGDTFEIRLPAASSKATLTAWKAQKSTSQVLRIDTGFGSGDGNTFSSVFHLKALAPGRQKVEFQSTEGPTHRVIFSFEMSLRDPGESVCVE
jgi:hypothetical protein